MHDHSGGTAVAAYGAPVGPEGDSSSGRVDASFPAETASVSAARHWASRWCREQGREGQVDALALVISELVGHAVLHGIGPIEVSLCRAGGQILGRVRDHDPTPPFGDVERGEASNWGISIVGAVTQKWGVDYDATGKSVHFALAVADPLG